jgi:chromosome partitioning protein
LLITVFINVLLYNCIITVKKRNEMDVIGIISTKGGSGKSHLAIALSVLSDENKGQTALVDLDPQSTAVKWSDRRHSIKPLVASATSQTFDKVMKAGRADNYKYMFVDTPPHAGRVIDSIAHKSDLIIVPVRPDPANLDALLDTWEVVSRSKNVLAVINGVPTDTSSDGDDLQSFIEQEYPDLPIAQTRLHQRKQFWQPHIKGQAVSELTETMTTMKAHSEIKKLWKEIRKVLSND